jgi:ribosome biogenesis GTPase A
MPHLVARGFTKSSQGNPDESRAARYILKDYVNVSFLVIQGNLVLVKRKLIIITTG